MTSGSGLFRTTVAVLLWKSYWQLILLFSQVHAGNTMSSCFGPPDVNIAPEDRGKLQRICSAALRSQKPSSIIDPDRLGAPRLPPMSPLLTSKGYKHGDTNCAYLFPGYRADPGITTLTADERVDYLTEDFRFVTSEEGMKGTEYRVGTLRNAIMFGCIEFYRIITGQIKLETIPKPRWYVMCDREKEKPVAYHIPYDIKIGSNHVLGLFTQRTDAYPPHSTYVLRKAWCRDMTLTFDVYFRPFRTDCARITELNRNRPDIPGIGRSAVTVVPRISIDKPYLTMSKSVRQSAVLELMVVPDIQSARSTPGREARHDCQYVSDMDEASTSQARCVRLGLEQTGSPFTMQIERRETVQICVHNTDEFAFNVQLDRLDNRHD